MRRWEMEEEMNTEEVTEVAEEQQEESTPQMEERHGDRSSMWMLISICIFVVALVATVTTVIMVTKNNKQKLEDAKAAEAFQEENVSLPEVPESAELNQSITEEPIQEETEIPAEENTAAEPVQLEEGMPVLNGVKSLSNSYVGFMLNAEGLPEWDIDSDSYMQYSETIDRVDCIASVSDEEAQDVVDFFASYLALHDIKKDGHSLFVSDKDESTGWLTVCDELDGTFYYMNLNECKCYKARYGLTGEELYKMDVVAQSGHEESGVRAINYIYYPDKWAKTIFHIECYECGYHYRAEVGRKHVIGGYIMPLDEWEVHELNVYDESTKREGWD